MPGLVDPEKPLPLFRRDIELYKGPDEEDGSPTFNLYDPVKARYYKISWVEERILDCMRPGMKPAELIQEVSDRTTINLTLEDLDGFYLDAFRGNLLALPRMSEQLNKEAEMMKSNPFQWLLYHYLYFRIPLFNPDEFLTRTLPYVKWIWSPTARFIYFFLIFSGISLLLTRAEEYFGTFQYFFNLEGAIIYAVAIISVKVVHEFSHAYTAKNYGIYVPAMGFAMIVLWPVLFTDVTDGWKLPNRKQRLAISIAGMAAELTIAGLCTIGWVLSSPGIWQSVFFVVSSVTWISTLVINANPMMRFDGYYILCDLWGVDNLQSRSFEITRWWLRKVFLGLDLPAPEEDMSPERRRGMIIYGISTFIYRFFLYIGIAVFVYYAFAKALGVFLFFLEVAVFIAWPIASEISELYTLRSSFQRNPRLTATLSIVAIIFLWFLLPLPHYERYPAITISLEQQDIYVPESSIIQKIFVKQGDQVVKGQPIVYLMSKQIDISIDSLRTEKQILEKTVEILGIKDPDRAYIPEKAAELASNDEKLSSLLEKQKDLSIDSNLDGKVFLWDPNLKAGQAVKKDQILGKIGDTTKLQVLGYIPEGYLDSITLGEEVEFLIRGHLNAYKGKVVRINPARSTILTHPPLGSLYGGPLPVTRSEKNGSLQMVQSYYTITIELDKSDLPIGYGQTGEVELEGPWRSKLMTGLRYFMSIVWRESGL